VVTGVSAPEPARQCPRGDSDCQDTFGRATRGQDRSRCCQYCGYYDCDVCGWAAEPVIGATR
jgi:hypothetical protein